MCVCVCACIYVYSIANRFFERPPIHKHKSISRDAAQRSARLSSAQAVSVAAARTTPMPLYKSYISSASACHNRCHCIPNMYESYRILEPKTVNPNPETKQTKPNRIEWNGMAWLGMAWHGMEYPFPGSA